MTKAYLGDGLYADYDGYQIVLTAENWVCATDTVYLEPMVYRALINYVDNLKNILAMEEKINSSTQG